MSEKKSRVKLSPEEWSAFREAYLKAFETMPRAQAYAAAVREMRLQNKPYPSFRTLYKHLSAYAAAVREMRLQNKPYPSFRTLYKHLSGKRNTAAPSEKTEPPKTARRRHGPPMLNSGRRTDD